MKPCLEKTKKKKIYIYMKTNPYILKEHSFQEHCFWTQERKMNIKELIKAEDMPVDRVLIVIIIIIQDVLGSCPSTELNQAWWYTAVTMTLRRQDKRIRSLKTYLTEYRIWDSPTVHETCQNSQVLFKELVDEFSSVLLYGMSILSAQNYICK